MTLTERENLRRVIFRDANPEWVPVSVDCIQTIDIDGILAERPVMGADGYDWFGCHWLFDAPTMGRVQDPKQPFIVSDITKWEKQLKFPDLDAVNWESISQEAEKTLDRENKMIAVRLESGIFERFHSLVGFENAFLDLMLEPEASFEMLSAIADYRIDLIRRIHQWYRPDLIRNLDDYGAQTAPMMSADMFREHIKPHLKRLGDAINGCGMIYEHHSCGTIAPLMDDLLDCGMKLLNLNPFKNDFDAMEKKYAQRVCITCGLNTNGVVCKMGVTEEELRAEVRRAMDQLAPYKNYVFFPAAVTAENNAILVDEARKYGRNYWNRRDGSAA